MSIPDPESLLSLGSLLSNEAILKELRLNDGDKSDISSFMRDNNGVLSARFRKRDGDGKLIEEELTLTQWQAKNLARLNELLDSVQLDRLRQLAYHIEITRVGFGQAIKNGCLGKKLDVQDYELSALEILITDAEKDLAIELDRIRRTSWLPILDILTQAQKDDFQRSMGKPFLFRERVVSAAERAVVQLTDTAIPEPKNPILLVALLRNDSVASEVGIVGNARATIFSICKTHSLEKAELLMGARQDLQVISTHSREVDEKHSNLLLEAMSSSTLERLREVAYQIEIHRMGLRDAFLRGFISDKLELTESQKQEIRKVSL